ncbi:MAG: V-type ATP synthase subunit D [Firmicutes bacterium]|nr:V-type ATP synthase subunit D [Bacillota bacterium]
MQIKVNPTRIELRNSKTRLKSMVAGHKLLKDKLDEMVRKFLAISNKTLQFRREVELDLSNSQKNFALARAIGGGPNIDSALCMPSKSISIEVATQSIMGVEVPVISQSTSNNTTELPYSLSSTPVELDDAIIKFYDLLEKLLQLAEAEKTIALLAEEMQKTRRRVNALEYVQIPNLKQTISYIQMKLDENDRATLARLMKVKETIE